jgi:hypothetical protein
MTRDEIIALSGRELDRVVAEKIFGLECVSTVWGPRCWRGKAKRHSFKTHELDYEPLDTYSTDRNAAALLLAEVERLGCVEEFVRELRRELYREHGDDDTMPQLWRFASATSLNTCRAALLAIGGAK